MILIEAVNDSSNEDAGSESDKEPSCDEEDESRRHLRTQYVHPKGKDKGGACLCMACVVIWGHPSPTCSTSYGHWCEATGVPKSRFNFDFALCTPLIYNSAPISATCTMHERVC